MPSSAETPEAAAARVAAASRPLGAAFRSHVLPCGADAARTSAWADAVLALCATAGWRGERLANALLVAAPAALPVIAPATLPRWTALAEHLRTVTDEAAVFRQLPDAVAAWTDPERDAWLDAALALPPAQALVCHRDLPPVLAGLAPRTRAALLDALRAAAPAAPAVALGAALPLLGALFGAVPSAARADAAALCRRVATAFPAGLPALLRALPRLHEEAAPDRVAAWASSGLEIAAAQPEAGEAFFALASRTSLRVLRGSATVVTLDEVQGVLRRVAHMLSGTPAVPRPSGRFQLRPPLEDDPGPGGVALPSAIDRLPTWEDNARCYRALVALLVGRRLHHTYAAHDDLATWLRAPERPAVLEDLFLLADGVRVAAAVGRAFPGLGADLHWAGAGLLRAGGPPAGVFDLLFALALAGDDAPHVPVWVQATAALVLPSLAPLRAPDATAADALRLAEALAPLFPETERGSVLEGLPDLITLLLDPAGDEGPYGDASVPMDGPGAAAPDDAAPPALPEDLLQQLELLLDERLAEGPEGATRPMTPEELRALVEAGLAAAFGQSRGTIDEQAGLWVTQLLGKRLAEGTLPLEAPAKAAAAPTPVRRPRPQPGSGAAFWYDEWDHVIDDYRPHWCRLEEIELAGDSGLWFDQALARHQALVPEIRRCFQRVKPELYRPVRGLEDGEEIDLNAVVDARAQHRARHAPTGRFYVRRERSERDVATLFLLDMSASTDETAPGSDERIIDIAKDTLVIMAAALEEIGDAYAIYGFSGQGREQVEVYPVKAFGERLGPAVQSRLGGIEPRGSTRMGAALRHVLGKLRGQTAPARHLVLLSDGFPQDLDYGTDRQSHVYGIRDTAVALREVQAAGVKPFCITVDLAGHDYLREMCDPQQYLIIENVAGLPRELPKIYQRLVRAA